MIGGVTTPAPTQDCPRRATEQDVAALVHLRSLMFASMGYDVGGKDADWRVAAAGWLRKQLTMPLQFAGFVMEHPADGEGPRQVQLLSRGGRTNPLRLRDPGRSILHACSRRGSAAKVSVGVARARATPR